LSGATKYCSPAGSNGADGSESTPYLTITYGITQLSGGDTLILRGGNYTNDWNLDGIPSGGSWSAPTTIINYTGESPVIRPQTTADVFGFGLNSGQYIVISGIEVDMTVSQTTGAGVKITENANHVMITNCYIHHTWECHGVLITEGNANNADSNIVANCHIAYAGWQHLSGSDDHGIYIKNKGNVVTGCTINNNLHLGIQLFDGNPDLNTIKGCTLYSNSLAIGIYSGNTNWIYNNVAYSNGIGFLSGYGSQNTYFLNNTGWRNGVNFSSSADMTTNAVFINNLAFEGTSTIDSGGFFIRDASKGVTLLNNLSVSNALANYWVYAGGDPVTNANKFGDSYVAGLLAPASGNFHIAESSDAVEAGLSQASIFTTDKDGVSRGASWDVGAFEFESSKTINATTIRAGTVILR
jgi:hypothetical protein